VQELNAHGSLCGKGANWFVCEALAGRRVQVEEVGRQLLVSYGEMYVRKINRERQRMRAVEVPRDVGRAFRSASVP
jgi:hypothetical protein